MPKNELDDGDRVADGEGGISGIGTPSPDMIETVLALFIFLFRPIRLGVRRLGSWPGVGA